MSRCYACDAALSDYESTRKSKVTGEYLDLCDNCFSEVSDVFQEIEENLDLKQQEDIEIEFVEL
jgi:hypothetical protein